MDPITSNFILTIVGVSVAGCLSLKGGIGNCMTKSRCTNISTPCVKCDRTLLSVDDPVYLENPHTPPLPIQPPRIPRLPSIPKT